jgi:chaperonin cofactor prefoldin
MPTTNEAVAENSQRIDVVAKRVDELEQQVQALARGINKLVEMLKKELNA